MVPVQKCKKHSTSRQDANISLFAAYDWMDKADLFRSTDRQFRLAEELNYTRHAVKRLAELAEDVATVVAHDLYVQNSAAASD